ncbi:MAG: DUF5688 family protein [Lachnospiraceae bacterium]|nr:DUF5688 family protein [Lachnospiraceae bacterium]
MDYKEFETNIIEKLAKALPADSKIIPDTIIKNNDTVINTLIINFEGSKLSPSIPLTCFYDSYKRGMSFSGIMDRITELLNNRQDSTGFDFNIFESFDAVKNKIGFQLVNYRLNKSRLEPLFFDRFMDLAVVYFICLDMGNDERGTVFVKNEFLEYWNVDSTAIREAAIESMPSLYPLTTVNLFEYLKSYSDFYEVPEKEYLILSNTENHYGAASILYPGALENLKARLGGDFYIVPSSIHELLVYAEDNLITPEFLNENIKEINESHVSKNEVLSDHVYKYQGGKLISM